MVRDVTSVTSRLKLHQELKAEIDAREDTFRTVAENGQLMIDAGHFAASDVCLACTAICFHCTRVYRFLDLFPELIDFCL